MQASKPVGVQLSEALNNASSVFREVKQLAVRSVLPARQGMTEESRARQNAVNEKAAAVRGGCEDAEENLRLALERAGDSDDVGEFMGHSEGARMERASLAQDLVRVGVLRLETAEVVLAEMLLIPPPLEREVEKTVAKVKSELEKIGCGLQAQVASSHGNAKAAERQLDQLARHGNLRSRAAMAALKAAQAEVEGARNTVTASHEILAAARQLLVKVAVKSLAG